MKTLRLILRNLLRHKLRTLLTILGMTIAVLSFMLLNTAVNAWYAASEKASPKRLVVRNAHSFIFPLPPSYRERIARIPGVAKITFHNWFQGVYVDAGRFFPRFAVDEKTYFAIYPEYIPSSKDDFENFLRDRNACIVGIKTAEKFNLKLGDIMNVRGDVFPGDWQFVVRAFYRGRDRTTDETSMFFHWDYLNEYCLAHYPGRSNQIGVFVVELTDHASAASVAESIDGNFRNSIDGTRTETEKEFQMNFLSMSTAIMAAIRLISFIVIGIILLVLANTMAMTARERVHEYAVLKTLGFTTGRLTGFIAGESLAIAFAGGILGMLSAFPMCAALGTVIPSFFFVFEIKANTILLAAALSTLVGIIASVFPILRILRTGIADGLRHVV